nr:hypothetical protein [Tanacetum cinerariifolium]
LLRRVRAGRPAGAAGGDGGRLPGLDHRVCRAAAGASPYGLAGRRASQLLLQHGFGHCPAVCQGGYLIELVKLGEKPQQYENLLRGYLYSPEAYLREAAVFSLLFVLQIKKEEYRACALKELLEGEEYEGSRFDARLWAAASLAVAYQGTKDLELLRIFFALLDDEATD